MSLHLGIKLGHETYFGIFLAEIIYKYLEKEYVYFKLCPCTLTALGMNLDKPTGR
jgi:hypothetical protein